MLSDKDLEGIRKRCDAATKGPWERVSDHVFTKGPRPQERNVTVAACECKADAEFIAHARTDIPALLQHIAALHRMLHDLTPGGSEFVDDPKRCLVFIEGQLKTLAKVAGERNALQQRVDEDRWIAVSESLPEVNLHVLIKHAAYTLHDPSMTVGWRDGAKNWYECGGEYNVCDVTHWRPLPAAPKEK